MLTRPRALATWSRKILLSAFLRRGSADVELGFGIESYDVWLSAALP